MTENMFHPDFKNFKYSNYIDYIIYYVGMKYNMKNLESETISAKEIIEFFDRRAVNGFDMPTIAQSNLSTTLKYLKDKKVLIDAGFVNRQKRYYFNFQSNFLNMDFGSPHQIFKFSRELTTFVFLSHIKNIDPKLFPNDPGILEYLVHEHSYDPFYNLNNTIQGFRTNLSDGHYCKHLIKKINGQEWFTGEDFSNLELLSQTTKEIERMRNISFTDTLG